MKKVILSTICPGTEDIQLALYYLKAYFNKYSTFTDSVEIEVIPFLPRQKPADTAKKLTEKNPDILGFSCYVWNIIDTLKICRYVKKAVPKVRIILGGPEVSPRATEILSNNSSVDIVVIGEGEETFKEVSEYFLFGRKSLETIDGIVYRLAKKVISNKKRTVIEDLDTIPSPYLQGLIDMNKYQSISTETHRGCLFRCHYCYYHKEFNQIRYFSLPRVERELAFILKKNPIGVYFMDPTFNADKERAKEVLRTFIKYNKTTRLHLELRAEFLDEETVELLHCTASLLEIGIQSTNPKTLKLINRYFAPKAFKKGIRLLNDKNIYGQIQVIDGLPQDNYQTLKKSIDWLYALHPAEVRIMRLMLLPGTYLRENARRFKITYQSQPPYYSIKSDTFSRADLDKTSKLRKAMAELYDSGLLRDSLYLLVKKLGVRFSEIFEEWLEWREREERGTTKAGSLKDIPIPHKHMITALRDANSIELFVEYLCNKYSKGKRKGSIPEEIKKSLLQDRNNFFKNIRIKEKKVY